MSVLKQVEADTILTIKISMSTWSVDIARMRDGATLQRRQIATLFMAKP